MTTDAWPPNAVPCQTVQISDAIVTTVMYLKTCGLRVCDNSAAVMSVKRTADAVTVM